MTKKTYFWLLLITFLTLPSFSRMLKPGIYTMHDFHIFRLRQYHLCILDAVFPCRWAPDSTWQYGQPLFNFYGQLPYILGEPFQLLGVQTIDTIKILFIFSLVGSGFTMFLLARQLWTYQEPSASKPSRSRMPTGTWAALISSLIYIYAPYRAVDVWVRAALPEALAFVLFPLIIFFFNKFILESPEPKSISPKYLIQNTKYKPLVFFSLSLALLITTHNLSAIMFLFFAIPWGFYFLIRQKKLNLAHLIPIAFSGIFSLLLSAFYLLPVILETKLITLNQTTVGYYNYQAHFTTLQQLLLSRFWGYGASLWGPVDDLSLSVGQIQWLLPNLIFVFIAVKSIPSIIKNKHLQPLIRNSLLQSNKLCLFLIPFSLGWFALFLSHGRSLFLWKLIPPLTYVQFPWRFLSIATFSFSLSAGAVILLFTRAGGTSGRGPVGAHPATAGEHQREGQLVTGPALKLSIIITTLTIISVILLNQNFFRPDIWREITDKEQFSGPLWEEQVASAISDFWPATAPQIPHSFAPQHPIIQSPKAGAGTTITKKSHSATYQLELNQFTTIQLPIVYFPGWKAFANNQTLEVSPSGDFGLITTQLPAGNYQVKLRFTNTPPRTIGNLISLASLIALATLLFFPKTRNS